MYEAWIADVLKCDELVNLEACQCEHRADWFVFKIHLLLDVSLKFTGQVQLDADKDNDQFNRIFIKPIEQHGKENNDDCKSELSPIGLKVTQKRIDIEWPQYENVCKPQCGRRKSNYGACWPETKYCKGNGWSFAERIC